MTAELWGAEFKMIVTFEVQWNPVIRTPRGHAKVSVLSGCPY